MKIIPTAWCFWAAACTINQDLILVHPDFKDDEALIEHEIEHTRQMQLVGTLTFWFKYIFSRAFRLIVEVDAYKVQMKYGASINSCATNLSTRYALGISQDRAMKLLKG